MKTIILILFRFYFLKVLTGRYLDIDKPEAGRFNRSQLKQIYKKIKTEQSRLKQEAQLEQYKSYGNRLMIYCGVLSLSAYRILRKEGLTQQYATLLLSDVIWRLYILGTKIIWYVAWIKSRDSQQRLNYMLQLLCKFPFNPDPKGYQFTIQVKPDHLATEFTQCAVYQFMKLTATDEEIEFFRNSWCLYDFALPSYLIDGGCYQRQHTLSQGDEVCDMKWYAKHSQKKTKKC